MSPLQRPFSISDAALAVAQSGSGPTTGYPCSNLTLYAMKLDNLLDKRIKVSAVQNSPAHEKGQRPAREKEHRHRLNFWEIGDPYGNRTRVYAVKVLYMAFSGTA